ncbi:hypothetical protein QC820_08260 [Halomonas mongoliensis]|uniref:Uncharacterized protein n=1 Tax=Halomonas mongoliensis TaxID=321265 RepID=A0ABU1GLV6_9GAMM|nr:hypothetical protein [Halomonas mongoliensis]MDR5892810.1 hypothetical protein [Halomonas mongoliensis]
MSEDKHVAPFMEIQESGTNIDLAVQQAQKMTEILDAMNIEKATFRTGATFHRDPKTNVATLATDGLMVQQGEHTTTVTLRNPGSTERQALEELQSPKPMTQETLGSFSGKSQPWASVALSQNSEDD